MNIRDLMARIDTLQEYDEPMVEEYTPIQTTNTLLAAMLELREDGIIESVDPHAIFNQVKEIHREFRDIEEGDLPDRIYWFDEYKTSQIPLSQINLNEFEVDEDLVEDYIEYIKDSPTTMPPIVYDPVAGSVIDGMHRANAYARLGYDSIPAYVGLIKSDSYGEREEVEEEFTFDQERKQLNIPELLKQGAIFVTHPHGPEGWETDRPDWDFSLITLQNVLQKSPNWVADYKKYISNDKKLTQDFINRISDEKYQQILWSIDKLNIPDNVAFTDKLDEASPNTLEGSFTPDLVESKTWLAEMLAKGLKGKNAGTIYVLGSWYGNMGIFLQQAGVQFDKLVLVEPDEEALMRSKDLLQQIGDEGKLVLIHQKAEDAVYEKPGVVINTSCNETGPVFLTKLPDNMLCLLQARNNNETTLFPTEQMEDFVDYFPLDKVYYTGEKQLEDPEINYTRFMKIGRTGKKNIDEGPDGNHQTGGALGLPFPGTYEQEYSNFKRHGQRRMGTLTTEALDSSYPYEFKNNAYYFITDAGEQYRVMFDGDKKVEVSFAARGKNNQPKDDITGTGDSRKVFGTVINIVKDYVSQHNPEIIVFAADSTAPSRVRLYKSLAAQADKALPGYTFAKTLKNAMYTVFYLTRDNIKVPKLDTVKNVAGRVLDKVVGE